MSHLFAIALALLLDALIGDPRWLPHPVRALGSLIAFLDRRLNQGKHRRAKGIAAAVAVTGIAYSLAFFVVSISYSLSLLFGVLVEAVLIFTAIATKSLQEAAWNVLIPLEQGDMEKARRELSMIVGRDTENLGEPEIVRACVETVAENTSDGITAPLFYAFIGGAPLALFYRAVNTCDSMLGYKNDTYREFGWASARLDDVVNYVPARLTAMVMILVYGGRQMRHCFHVLFRDASKHPSPNSGWPEAAMAALLGVQLGGTNTYKGVVSRRPAIGDPLVPLNKEHIRQAVRIMIVTVLSFALLLFIGGMIIELASAWGKPSAIVSAAWASASGDIRRF
ncbi:adenosylcobinamide-phosphate synthase CbiB [Parageobacillus thermoglucosidasius]|uniref:Cobalamin biosynthesis protein CobD n=2 Tax=Parageobacillus thermoglucosidasius TaxID=1426 RepID=A0AAN0YQ88_PARTM|nr:adenosylcobinamide-phosphate synthase CbiB [Parageobacillus thermoglucosidasius]ALF11369.1 cobalamin biosynthesis protein CobD [Parageobacillus thermoglucosidasius]ANZ31447.1 adenosylcobinamide-phosphate synthase [Parageobacillus thermoglucosidasius]APM82184.1 adenosylcobinamide-phosphate synthase [Parageobacillus thermoglucosidasius]KJX69086.1 cobalamin biosynthesis protein CobD [Parageobacillus thermoglucosidasius]RDE25922.1 cobalamin biosynthesis protein [Parageobacillus thermoglucosidas